MTKRKSSRSARILKSTLKAALYFTGGTVAVTALFAAVPVPGTLTMLLDSNGAKRDWTALSDISPNLVRAVIAAEDGKFCSHDGFDREAIEKALSRNKQGGRMRGGSTISQQTAKNVFLWQGSGWTRYVRKIPEVYFTFLIEKIWGKRRIMEVYLNVAETGIGTYGAEAGAQRYFNKSAKKPQPDRGCAHCGHSAFAKEARRQWRRRLHPPIWQQHRRTHPRRQTRWPRQLHLHIKKGGAEAPPFL